MSDYVLHYVVSLSMITMSGALIGIFALLRRHSHSTALVFAMYCFAVAWWAFWQIFMIVPTDLTRAHIAGKISQIGVALIATFFYHFCIRFLNSNRRLDRILLKLGYAFSVVILALIPTPYVTAETVPKFGGKVYFLVAGPVDIFYISYFFCIVIYALVRLFQAYRRLTGYEKEQIKWVIIGTFAAYLGGGANYFLSFGIDPYPWIPFGNYGVVINFICFAYAVFRYRFLDIEQVTQAFRKERLAALGLLSASINHEIRSPLFVIKGHAETLLENLENGSYKNLPESAREKRVEEALKKTIEQTSRVVEITKRLTDFSKPQAGVGVPDQINLNEVADNVLSFVGYGLKVDNIHVEKAIDSNLTLQGDRRELEQIFLNLIINASQAMEKRTGEIKIEASDRNGTVEIRVSDTGPGISPERIHNVFEPFFTTKESGTGLGLYVTKQLVERNQGRISVESQLGQGTTFILIF